MNEQLAVLKQLINASQRPLIIQADNPDGDSLGSSLALEQILGEMGKQPAMYGAVDVPGYLRYLPGWDRVSPELPKDFDAVIIVDASTTTLLQKLQESGQLGSVSGKPCVVLDHHQTADGSIDFAQVVINEPARSSTGELIYAIAKALSWPLDATSGAAIMTAILGDTQGLSNDLTSAETYRIMAELTELGVSRPQLEEARREYGKMPPEIFHYKAQLIQRTELLLDGKLALVTIPQTEIETFSPLYNPAPLIQSDMLQTTGVGIAIVLKHYNDGKILASIRCNQGFAIGGQLAEHFGGGGHNYAAGFKLLNAQSVDKVKQEVQREVEALLSKESTT